jgi:hypothetical protein
MDYIKYNDLKKFLLSFDESEDDIESIKLINFKNKFPEVFIYISIDSHNILLPKDIVFEILGCEEDIPFTDLFEFKDELLNIKMIDFNIENNSKIFNLFEEKQESLKLIKKIERKSNQLDKKSKLISIFEKYQKCYQDISILCFDFEAFEKKQDKLTELGISIFKNGTFSSIHYIAKENLHYKNGKNINDRRYNFNFGQSKTIELHDIMLSLKKELNKCDLVIGHGIDNDFTFAKRYLKQQNKLSKNYISDKDCSVVDTYELSKMYRENGYGMQGMLELLDIPHRNLHNGGNDSRYNLVMFNAIMETFDDNLKNTFIKTINLLEEEIIELQENFDSSFKLL